MTGGETPPPNPDEAHSASEAATPEVTTEVVAEALSPKPKPTFINVEDLLHPISEQQPCGVYLKYENIYDEIKEHRREDDPRLSQGVWQTEPKKASWRDVKKICERLLKTKTKDLQIATWLLESLIIMYGFEGLNQGIILLHSLCEKFWDDVYPQIDLEDNDISARMSPFFFFSEKLQDRILMVPITDPIDGILLPYSLSDWVASRYNMRVKKDGLSSHDLKKSVAVSNVDFLEKVYEDISESYINLQKLDDFITERCPKGSPSFQAIYGMFSEIQQISKKNIDERQVRAKQKEAERQRAREIEAQRISENDHQEAAATASDAENSDSNQERPTVEYAYQTLENIAAFLEERQPQSPASVLIKIASTIGRKTFQELMATDPENNSTVITAISELCKVLKRPG